jgi:DNA polymerase-3 subunit beta
MKKAAVKKVILKVEGHGQIKADPGSKPFTVLRKAGFNPKLFIIGNPEETANTITYRITKYTAEKGPEPKAPDLPEPPKMKTVYGEIEGSPKLCPKCNGYYPGEMCPKCAGEDNGMPSPEEEHLTFTDAPSGSRLDSFPKEEPFEPLHLDLSRELLIEALKVAMDITEKKSIMPILSHVHLKSSNKTGFTLCLIEATDLQVSWIRALHCKGDSVDRCIPAKLLMKEVKALPDGARVDLTFSRDSVSVNGRCDIITADGEEFPEIKVDPDLVDSIPIENLSEGLKRISPAISTDETRYVLTSALIDPENGKVVGTDGFRMHLGDIKGPGPRLLIPRNAVKLLTKHGTTDAVKVIDEKLAVFSVAGGVITTRLMEGNFPNYADVLPKPKTTITFNSADFLKLLEGALAVDSTRVVLGFDNGNLTLQSENGVGTYDWRLPAEGPAKKFCLTFNGMFLVDALKSFPAVLATLGAPEGYGACLINEKAIVMPIRV